MRQKIYILFFFLTACTNFKYKPTKVLFNVPALVGHNIDEIVKTLGKPTFYPKPRYNKKSYCNYHKEGWVLSIRYYPNTRKVIDFSVYPADEIYEYKDLKDVLRVGNLDSAAVDYIITPGKELFASSGTYTDVTVIPKY